MNWRFTIIDFTTDANGVSTILTEAGGALYEPIGWADCQIDVNRDEDMKGVFFDYSLSSLKWTDKAAQILEAAYNAQVAKAHVEVLIEFYCPQCSSCDYATLTQSRFNFLNYKKVVADFCYVEVPLETASALLTFNNLYDQKVDLESLLAYDLKTPLVPYGGLGQVISLRNKTVIVRTLADNTGVGIGGAQFGPQPITYELWNDQNFTTGLASSSECWGYFSPPFNNVKAIDVLQSFIQYPIIGLNTRNNRYGLQIAFNDTVSELDIRPQYLVYRPRALPINFTNLVNTGSLNIDIKLKGTYSDGGTGTHAAVTLVFLSYFTDVNGNVKLNKEIFKQSYYPWQSPDFKFSFDYEYTNPAYQLQPGEGLWVGFIYLGYAQDAKPVFVFDQDNHINIQASTTFVDTPCKVFFINEVLSRIAENITSGELPVVSDYYGRTDSQPYAAAADGEGALRVLTKGLIMRGLQQRLAIINGKGGYLNNFDNSPESILNNINIFSLSFQDVFESLDAQDCIGTGMEDDPTRPGKSRLRVEQADYFFQENILMILDNVYEIDRQTKSSKYYSLLNFGYEKWETNSYDGLDEFLTKRQYRSTFTTINNTLDKTCKFIASGYAIEYCRRLSGDATTDSEFDNDTFVICVKPLSLLVQSLLFQDAHTIYVTGQVITLPVGSTFEITGAPANNGTYTVVSCGRNVIQSSPTLVYGGDTIIVVQETLVDLGATVQCNVAGVNPRLYQPEQGNITTASGEVDQSTTFLVDPSTIYNWRISPFRNMMRWLQWLLAMYADPEAADSKFIFVNGDGNYFATGQQLDPAGKLENVDVKESQNLSINIMADKTAHQPLFHLDEDTLTYPMSAEQFVAIKANPYGLIQYYHDTGDIRLGWISKISYSPVQGMAKYTLIPKRQ